MNNNNPKTILQDYFDEGFVKALTNIQQKGYLRNESLLEKDLQLQRGRIYEIKRGMRHVPKKKRDYIMNYLRSRYDVNLDVFVKKTNKIFNNDPPHVNEMASDYEIQRVRATAGDVIYIQKLEDEIKHLLEDNTLLRKLVSSMEKQLEKNQKKSNK